MTYDVRQMGGEAEARGREREQRLVCVHVHLGDGGVVVGRLDASPEHGEQQLRWGQSGG
jgi:hypothetical protein